MKDRIFTSLDRQSNRLFHYGTPHQGSTPHSGRYAWGSGEASEQRSNELRAFANEMRQKVNPDTGKKYTDTEIARAWGVSTTEYRKVMSSSKAQERAANIAKAIQYRDQGLSPAAIATKMGESESTVRSWLLPKAEASAKKKENIVSTLKDQVEEKTYLDIGKGVGAQLGISDTSLKNAVYQLQQEGYKVQTIKVEQATNPRQKTTIQVLTKDDVPWQEVNENKDLIRSPNGVWMENNGETMRGIREPVSIDSSRIKVNYADTGNGLDLDGTIFIRPGVPDLALGDNHYAQVRIAVDGTHYLKGMALYSDKIPEGYDIQFNTNKTSDVPMTGPKDHTVLKGMKDDPDNPFGSTIRQFDYIGADGKEHQSAINLVNTDEDWNKWSKNLASQMLSKQQPALAKRQLDLVYQEKKDLFDEISKYPNDTIKQKLLFDLAEDCDSAAVHLKAAALPRQEQKVILPLQSIKDNEIYAPTYKNGEEVVLIRYPHQGVFEIPRLIVNNNNPEGKEVLGDAKKAVGINAKVAQQLSGADFDGDTVTVIPTVNQNIKTSKPLAGMDNFDAKVTYKAYEGMPRVGKEDGFDTQMQMGKISNLVTDMTIKGASEAELVRAEKHAQVVIDAEKHNLNWKQSYEDQQIAQLKEKYQGGANKGASTIISKAKSEERVPMRSERYHIDPDTGEITYYTAKDANYTDKNGKPKVRTESSTKMAEAKDAYELVSRDSEGNPTPYQIERVYADHANRLKALANEVRKEYARTPNGKLNRDAAELYAEEVKSLGDKLRLAEMNAPYERLAQAAASKQIANYEKTLTGLSKKEKDETMKKYRDQVIKATRTKAGALSRKERVIKTTDREWEAIVAGALSAEKTRKILTFMDTEEVLARTSPRETRAVSSAKLARAKAMLNAGYTWSDVADAVGVSESTLRNNI